MTTINKTNMWYEKIFSNLLNQEFNRWQTIQEKAIFKRISTPPSITVSRETGSGGRLIAEKVASELKLKFYNKSIVKLIAKQAKKQKELISSFDEKERNMIEDMFKSLLEGYSISSATYLRNLIKVIFMLGKRGNCLILGRGANFILSPAHTLRVRIIAPLKTRIENTVKFENKAWEQAEKDIRNLHFGRKNFVKKSFRKDISNTNLYDLVVNTQYLTIDQASEIVIKTFKRRFD